MLRYSLPAAMKHGFECSGFRCSTEYVVRLDHVREFEPMGDELDQRTHDYRAQLLRLTNGIRAHTLPSPHVLPA